jgi:hypothetical protein
MKKIIIFVSIVAFAMISCGKTKKNAIPLFLGDSKAVKSKIVIPAVSDGATLTSLSVAPALVTIAQNTHANYTATGVYSDGSQRDLTAVATWSTESAIASVVTSTNGRFLGTSVGSGTIKVSFETLSATANLTVTAATLASIQIGRNPVVPVGTTVAYTAIGLFSDGTTQDITGLVTWSSSNTSSLTISSTGSGTGVSVGTTTVSATTGPALASRTGTTNTNVSAITLVSITVSGLDSILKGSISNYRATGIYSDGTQIDITNSVSWSSSSNSVGNISDDPNFKGLFSAVIVGNTNLTATLNGVSGSKPVAVIQPSIASISVQPNSKTIAKNTNFAYSAIATFSDGSLLNITNLANWSSANTSIAGVATSSSNGGLATGVSSGSVTLTASLGGISGTANLTVTDASLVSINIGSNFTVNLGSTRQLSAIGTYSDGSTQDITSLVTWLTSNSAIGFISNTNGSKGLISGDSAGSINVNASVYGVTSNIVQASVIGQIAGNNVVLPDGYLAGTTPTGNFTGITFGGGTDVAGFVATVPDRGTTSCTTLGASLLALISADTGNITASNLISSNTVGTSPNCSALFELGVTTNGTKTTTQLSNALIQTIGINTIGGTVSALPANPGGSIATNDFRVLIQATYSTTGGEVIGVGVSSEANFPVNQAVLVNFLNGTNIRNSSAVFAAKIDSFIGTADSKVDFVWMVDNSGSMASEQSAVTSNSVTFFNKLANKHLDFRLGVIATGGNGTNKCSFTAATKKGNELFGTGWTTSVEGSAGFQSNVSSVGIAGCGDETGIYSTERALGGHAGVPATVVPRAGAKVVIVMLSDEGDYYECYNGGSKNGDSNLNPPCNAASTPFNFSNNIFVNNGHTVYTITGLAANGQPGTCSDAASGTAADNLNNGYPYYKQLAAATGGSSASICNSDYGAILDNIVNSSAANSSTYELTKIPVSTSIIVKKNGTLVTQNSSNGWLYNSTSNAIVFAGAAYPNAGDSVEVSYTYDASVTVGSGLTAFIAKVTNSSTTKIATLIALLVGLILLARTYMRNKELA